MGFINKAIFMHKVTNGAYLENTSSLFVVKNNDNYNLLFLKKASAIQV
jgi:hypothetical protein